MIARILVVLLGVSASLFAQVGVTVGPSPAPPGCPIAVSIANDQLVPSYVPSPCPFVVRDAVGATVFAPFCPAVIVPLQPGQVFTTTWNQVNDFNVPVPPGNYFVDVYYAGGMTTVLVVIDAATQAAVAPLGPIRIGRTRSLHACAPADAGFSYLMGASGLPFSGGVPTCGGVVPLEIDALLLLSLTPNPYFSNFTGTLGVGGQTSAPSVTLPFDPALVGVNFVVAFIVVDPAAACFVRRVSAGMLVLVL